MTSCPTEEDLVLFVEGETADGDAVADHLTECAACRGLVARSEAALRYALGGLADRERESPDAGRDTAPAPEEIAPPPRPVWVRGLATAFVASATVAVVALVVVTMGPGATTRDTDGEGLVAMRGDAYGAQPRSLDERLDALLADADRLAAPVEPDERSDVALAALAAAEARADLAMPTAVARLHDVVDRFPGTPEAREARARIAMLEGGR